MSRVYDSLMKAGKFNLWTMKNFKRGRLVVNPVGITLNKSKPVQTILFAFWAEK